MQNAKEMQKLRNSDVAMYKVMPSISITTTFAVYYDYFCVKNV